jgi:hypothetical protein
MTLWHDIVRMLNKTNATSEHHVCGGEQRAVLDTMSFATMHQRADEAYSAACLPRLHEFVLSRRGCALTHPVFVAKSSIIL